MIVLSRNIFVSDDRELQQITCSSGGAPLTTRLLTDVKQKSQFLVSFIQALRMWDSMYGSVAETRNYKIIGGSDLLAASKFFGIPPVLFTAAAVGKDVFFSSAMLDQLSTEGISFVLLHELNHHINGHVGLGDYRFKALREQIVQCPPDEEKFIRMKLDVLNDAMDLDINFSINRFVKTSNGKRGLTPSLDPRWVNVMNYGRNLFLATKNVIDFRANAALSSAEEELFMDQPFTCYPTSQEDDMTKSLSGQQRFEIAKSYYLHPFRTLIDQQDALIRVTPPNPAACQDTHLLSPGIGFSELTQGWPGKYADPTSYDFTTGKYTSLLPEDEIYYRLLEDRMKELEKMLSQPSPEEEQNKEDGQQSEPGKQMNPESPWDATDSPSEQGQKAKAGGGSQKKKRKLSDLSPDELQDLLDSLGKDTISDIHLEESPAELLKNAADLDPEEREDLGIDLADLAHQLSANGQQEEADLVQSAMARAEAMDAMQGKQPAPGSPPGTMRGKLKAKIKAAEQDLVDWMFIVENQKMVAASGTKPAADRRRMTSQASLSMSKAGRARVGLSRPVIEQRITLQSSEFCIVFMNDSSGSVGNNEYAQYIADIRKFVLSNPGVKAYHINVDAGAGSKPLLLTPMTIDEIERVGYGGTNMDKGMPEALKMLDEMNVKPNIIALLTDGGFDPIHAQSFVDEVESIQSPHDIPPIVMLNTCPAEWPRAKFAEMAQEFPSGFTHINYRLSLLRTNKRVVASNSELVIAQSTATSTHDMEPSR